MEVYSLHKLRHRFNQQTKIDDLNKLVKDLKENPINKDVLIEQLYTFESILVGNSNKSIFDACFDIINIFHSKTIEKLSKYNVGVEIEDKTLNEFKIESKSILLALLCKRLINFYLYKSKEPIYVKFINSNVYTDFLIISKDIKETYIKDLIISATDTKHENYNEVLDFLLTHYKKEKLLNSKDILINEIYNYLEDLKKTPQQIFLDIDKLKHDDVFCNNGFELFEYILENNIQSKGKKGRYADISYFYWRMYNDNPKFVHQRPEVFKSWFCGLFDDSFEKIRTLNEVEDLKGIRNKNYSNALSWFKHQKNK